MERLARQERGRSGITRQALRLWALVFVVAGVVARSILQLRLLNMGNVSSQELFDAMMASEQTMIYATLALILQAVESCAIPIFAFLLVEGVQRTRNLGKYFLRVLGAAAVSELPYNLAMSGSLWDASSRNPVFGLVLAMVMLMLYQRFAEKKAINVAMKVLITLAAVLWPVMLRVQDGTCCVVLVAVLWLSRNVKNYRVFIGCAAGACCSIFSPFYLATPMGFLAVHFYRGDKGEENRLVNYLAYPVLLLAATLAGAMLK